MNDEDHFNRWIASTLRRPDKNQYVPNMRFAAYADACGVNGSTFMKPTTLDMKFEALRPYEPDYGLTLGELVHMAILEPDFFETDGKVEERFQFSPTAGLNTKAATQAYSVDSSRPLVTPEMVDKARYMRDAAIGDKHGNNLVKQLFKSKAERELSGFAWHEEQQLIVKTRVDFRPIDGNFLLDIKTCQSVEETPFWSDIRKWQYHCKASFYLDVDAIITGKLPRELFILVAISGPKGPSQGVRDAPYKCHAYDIGSPVKELSLIEEGRAIYQNRLAMFGNAARTNTYEAYENQSELTVLTVFRPRAIFKTKQPDDE